MLLVKINIYPDINKAKEWSLSSPPGGGGGGGGAPPTADSSSPGGGGGGGGAYHEKNTRLKHLKRRPEISNILLQVEGAVEGAGHQLHPQTRS